MPVSVLSPAAWLSERRRAGVCSAVAVAVTIGLGLADLGGLGTADYSVIGLGVYLVIYLTVSAVAFCRVTPGQIGAWARREGRGSFVQRYVTGTAPGPGASLTFAAASLLVAVTWLPADDGAALPRSVRVVAATLMIAAAWASVAISFAITYLGDNLVDGGRGLDFPGGEDPVWVDYVYFAVAVMASFGTTDVAIRSRPLRRTVTVNTVVAFVFNTVIVATLVSALAGL